MAGERQMRLKLVNADALSATPPRRSNRVNLFELAYERIEHLIVTCDLKPGCFLAIQDLQKVTGFSRTPVHQAVSRLADDTLILVRPRHGVQIAPIDLARERMLLHLRRDIERFVIRLAAERSGPSHRNQFLHMERHLRERRDSMTVEEFNVLDRRIDKLILAVAGGAVPGAHRAAPSHDLPPYWMGSSQSHPARREVCRQRLIATSPSLMPSPTGTSTTPWPHPMPSSILLTACLVSWSAKLTPLFLIAVTSH